MSRKKHWTEAVAEDLRREVDTLALAAREVFAETRRPPRQLSRRDQLKQFLTMDRQERMALFAEMGPEKYGKFLDRTMADLAKLVGPTANVLWPYLYADGLDAAAVQDDVANLEGTLNRILGGDDTVMQDMLLEEETD